MLSKWKPYVLNFGLTTALLIVIAAFARFTPFGSETMLTVDLGQQYIDFYSLFKETLTQHPEQLLYSFQKAFGGEMIGVWAYYLLSPFNLIFLLFDETHLAQAVTFITYLKIVSASMSFFYFSRKKYELATVPAMLFSQCYALMSYVMVFMLNIMWLDGLVFLPLIALGLDRLVQHKRYGLYIGALATLLMANYYIGYMVCLFLVFYAVFVIAERQANFSLKKWFGAYMRFACASLVAACMSAIVLVPTFSSLLHNKATHMTSDFNWDTAHTVQDVASKFFMGSFNFDEMSKGSPNLYAGILVVLLVIGFFFVRSIKWSEKIIAFGILAMFQCVFYFKALDRIWHGGQFPIWYHFRFSFITTFFLIVLAIKMFQRLPSRFPLWIPISAMIGLVGFVSYYYWLNAYEFLTEWQFFTTLAFGLVLIIVLQLEQVALPFKHIMLLAVVSCELLVNGLLISQELSYVDLSKFDDYVATLNQSVAGIRHDSSTFYRIHTTYQRTKDEAMFAHFNGLNHFGSTIEASVPRLYGYLGLPDGSGFANYTNGTLFTDDFFNIRYLLNPTTDSAQHTQAHEYVLFQVAYDTDLQAYPRIHTMPRYELYENVSRLGLGMEVSDEIASDQTVFVEHQPIANQELLLRLLDTQGTGEPYFTEQMLEKPALMNVTFTDNGDGDYYTYTRDKKDDHTDETEYSLTWHFATEGDKPYYFTLPSQIEGDNAELFLNGEPYKIYTPFRKRQVTNATYHVENPTQTLRLDLKKDDIKINPVRLYAFDEARYNALIESKQASNLMVTHFQHHHIEGTITTQEANSYILLTIPYDAHWQVTLDGQKAQLQAVLNDTLMAIPVTKGTHTLVLHYFPTTIWVGAGVSLIGILMAIGLRFLPYFKKNS